MSRIPELVAAEVHERADGLCEHCGQLIREGEIVALHHRLALKHGGPNTTSNLMLVIGWHHNLHQESIHSRVARSRELGHIIPSWDRRDPADIPVLRLAAS